MSPQLTAGPTARRQRVLRLYERIDAPYWIARTKLDYADLLTERDTARDPQRAEDLVGQALVTARDYGFGTLERRGTTHA